MGITGRPKSQNPKSIMASVRITEAERDALIASHQTVNAGLRYALDRILAEPVRIEPTASAEGTPSVMVTLGGDGKPARGSNPNAGVTASVGATAVEPVVIIDSLDYPGGRGKAKMSKPHVHKPASLVSSRHEQGALLETWACECGTYLPERKAK